MLYASLEEILEEGKSELSHFGLFDWKIVFNKRLTRRVGLCYFHSKTIELSVPYCLDNIWNRSVRLLILHEIAHAYAYEHYNCTDHGEGWVKACNIVGAIPSLTINEYARL